MRLLGEWRAAHDDEPHAAAEQGADLVKDDPVEKYTILEKTNTNI